MIPRCEALRPSWQFDGPAQNGLRRLQAFLDDVGERGGVTEHVMEIAAGIVGRARRASAARRIEAADLAILADHQQAGRHARDDLAAQPLGGFRARLHRALLHAQVLDRVLNRARHEGGLVALLAVTAGEGAGGGEEAQNGERDHGDHDRHDRREAEKETAGASHEAREHGSRASHHTTPGRFTLRAPLGADG